jgi:DNA repair protein RadB
LQHTVRTIPTGCGSLDKILDGGLNSNDVTLVYAEAKTGKTSLAIQCSASATYLGLKAIFIDSDGTFSPRRLAQIADRDVNEVAPKIILIKPTTFQEQALAIDRLDEYLTSQVGLVVIDSVTSLYRVELDESKEKTFKLNRELGRQLACLAQIAKTRKVTTLLTSQVRSVFLDGYVTVEPVATRVLRFWSDTVLNLKPFGPKNTLQVVLEKNAQHDCPVSCYVSLRENGIRDCR